MTDAPVDDRGTGRSAAAAHIPDEPEQQPSDDPNILPVEEEREILNGEQPERLEAILLPALRPVLEALQGLELACYEMHQASSRLRQTADDAYLSRLETGELDPPPPPPPPGRPGVRFTNLRYIRHDSPRSESESEPREEMAEMYGTASETTRSGLPKARILCDDFMRDTCQHSRCSYLHNEFLRKVALREPMKYRETSFRYSSGHATGENNEIVIAMIVTGTPFLRYQGEHFANSASSTVFTYQWQEHMAAALGFGQIPTNYAPELFSRLICSLFGTEATHPDCRGLNRAEFELSRAPKLYSFLSQYLKPFIHSRAIQLSWDVVLAIACICGDVISLYHEQKDMIYSTRPFDYQEWRAIDVFPQFFEDVILSTGSQDHYDSGEADLPAFIRQHLHYTSETLKHDDVGGVMKNLLNCLTRFLLYDYVTDPPRDEWLREVSRPILDLNEEGRRGYRSRLYHEEDAYSEVMAPYPTQALQESRNIQFYHGHLSLERLRKLDSRWKVVWTSKLARHLVLREAKTIYVYWPTTSILKKPRYPNMLQRGELRRTYALLFTTTSSHLAQDRQAASDELWANEGKDSCQNKSLLAFANLGKGDAADSQNTGLDAMILKQLLEPYLATEAPEPILKMYGKLENTTIGELLATTSAASHDLFCHMQAILMFPYQEEEPFSDFPYFGDRIRLLTLMLQEQKPKGLWQLWRDSRGTIQWWTFWLVLIFGASSLLLALGSLAVSTAQTWASFQALKPQ